MPAPKWLKITLLALVYILLGYVRHVLILHANIASSNQSIEFSQEYYPALKQAFQQFYFSAGAIENLLQVFFLVVYWLLGIATLRWLQIGNIRWFQWGFPAVAVVLFVLATATGIMQQFSLNSLLRSVFVKLQSPLPILIFILIVKAGMLTGKTRD